ncbi:MAG: flagellar type III secretion system pore protein FliP [Pseudomonadales bacterium]|nr:flagellar type III secretion system pore protein FliP [Pseudomonadales bacterium]
MERLVRGITFAFVLVAASSLHAADIPALTMVTGGEGEQSYSVSIQILAIMTVLTMLPSFVIMMTSFTRIIVVFAILRQAIGLQQTPSNQILVGLAIFLTLFIMAPVFQEINEVSLQPYLEESIGAEKAISEASGPLKKFMLDQVRVEELVMFNSIAGNDPLDNTQDVSNVDIFVLVPAFMTSELKTAFIIGFSLFIPFLVIDMVVASILMSMGMMMLSPLIISLPFKVMLFVLVDGWVLVMSLLATGFGTI